MKFLLSTTTTLALLFSTEAFVLPSSRFGLQTSTWTGTALNLERGDSSAATEAALEASRKFGGTSKEARVAWDIVEEIRASDNSVAYKGKDTESPADSSKNKEIYEAFMELKKLGQLQKDHVDSIKHVTEQIRAIKISPPTVSNSLSNGDSDSDNSDASERVSHPLFDAALAEAKAMTDKHGVTSPEAKLAWESLEDIAGNDYSQVMKGAIDDDGECLVEMMEACEAMEELNRALFLKSEKETGAASKEF